MNTTDITWPDVIEPKGNCYPTPDGRFVRVTHALRVLGLGQEKLIDWNVKQERAAIMEAIEMVYSTDANPATFRAGVEAKIGSCRAGRRIMEQAGDIGTRTHQAIRSFLAEKLGQKLSQPILCPASTIAFMAFRQWWSSAGLTAVRMEQTVWSTTHEYAGTVDLFALDAEGRLGIVDYKSSAGIYESHHLQVVGYWEAAREQGIPVEWSKIVRLPKKAEDPLVQSQHGVEVVELGQMYGGKSKTREQLSRAFLGAMDVYHAMVA